MDTHVQKKLGAVICAGGGGAIERRPFLGVTILDVGAVIQQNVRHKPTPVGAGQMQRGVAILIGVIHGIRIFSVKKNDKNNLFS